MKLNVAVIGTGFIGRQHIEALMRVPRVEIVALVGVEPESLKSFQEEYGIPNVYESVEDLVNHEERIDVIHNCTPNGMHYDINKFFIERDIHVYCEKPLTKNSSESAHLLELLKNHPVKGGVNFNYRQNIIVEEMKERVSEIGAPWFVAGEYLQDWLLFNTDFDWRVDKEIGGDSRAIADIGSHCFDTLQYILGSKITAVEAKLFKKFDRRISNGQERNVDNEDAGVILVDFENGCRGIVRVSQVTAGKKNGLKVSIELPEQTLEWEQEQPDRLWIGNRDEPNQELYASKQYLHQKAADKAVLPNGHAVGWADAFTSGINNFYKTVLGNAEPNYATFEDGHYLMKVTEAVVLSAKENRKVEISL